MRRTIALTFVAMMAASLLSAATPPELFAKAKEQFRLASYGGALKTLQELDSLSQKPGYEKDRTAILPGLAFYRGACYTAVGREADARAEFEIFLTYRSNVSLDPALYPKKVITALEETRRALGEKGSPAPAETVTSLELTYREFPFSETDDDEGSLGEDWAEGPVRYVLTAQERQDYSRLSDPISRSEFVVSFWKTRDPKPETPANEFRLEFERRVAFADANFTQEETPGSQTDRGMVFIVLGPPSYVGRKPLTTGQDADDPLWARRQRHHVIWTASAPLSRVGQTARADSMDGTETRISEAASNWREVWHYRREHLPKVVPYLQVDFDFVTKQGYGQNVLQRDTQALDTLERAKARMRQPKA